MIKNYRSTDNTQLTTHFNVREFKCKCGRKHDTKLDSNLVDKLEKLHSKLKCSKIIVNSGYRCSTHDRNVGGSGMGQHVNGTAADIVCYDKDGKKISSKIVSCAAQDIGFGGIANINSTYNAPHVDVRSSNKWFGDETVTTAHSVCNDFYAHYGISKAEIAKYTGETAPTSGVDVAKPATVEPARKFDKSIAGTYKVKASALNLRRGAGTNHTILATLPKGTRMQCYGYYTTVSGVKWFLVQTKYKNSTLTGYASSEWLVKI